MRLAQNVSAAVWTGLETLQWKLDMQWLVAVGDWLAGLLPKSPSSPKLIDPRCSPASDALLFSLHRSHMSPGILVLLERQIQTITSLEILGRPIHNGAFHGPLCCGNHTQGRERYLGGPAMDAANL